jgi:hypothetical protein
MAANRAGSIVTSDMISSPRYLCGDFQDFSALANPGWHPVPPVAQPPSSFRRF